MDLQSGRVSAVFQRDHGTYMVGLDADGNMRWLSALSPSNQTSTARYRWSIIDPTTSRVMSSVELPFLHPWRHYLGFIDDRFIIGHEDNVLYILDLDNVEKGTQRLSLASTSKVCWQVPGSRCFAVQTPLSAPRSAGGAAPTGDRVDLYRIEDDGKPRVIATWNARLGSKWLPIGGDEHCILSLNTGADQIESRSTSDGSLLYSQPIPDGFDAARGEWGFMARRLQIVSPPRAVKIIDVDGGQWTPRPPGATVLVDELEGTDLQLWSDKHHTYFEYRPNRQYFVFDSTEQEVISEFTASHVWHSEFLDSGRLHQSSLDFGFSVGFQPQLVRLAATATFVGHQW